VAARWPPAEVQAADGGGGWRGYGPVEAAAAIEGGDLITGFDRPITASTVEQLLVSTLMVLPGGSVQDELSRQETLVFWCSRPSDPDTGEISPKQTPARTRRQADRGRSPPGGRRRHLLWEAA
jgi:hypothetical protein